jgi:hypothetical protein
MDSTELKPWIFQLTVKFPLIAHSDRKADPLKPYLIGKVSDDIRFEVLLEVFTFPFDYTLLDVGSVVKHSVESVGKLKKQYLRLTVMLENVQ